jgi:hypothetical protein
MKTPAGIADEIRHITFAWGKVWWTEQATSLIAAWRDEIEQEGFEKGYKACEFDKGEDE